MEVDVFGHEAGRAQVSAPALQRFADEVVGHASLLSVSLQSVIFELSIGKRYLQYVTKQIPAGQLRSRTDGPAPVARCAVNNFVIQ
jgi:hypothetical protein